MANEKRLIDANALIKQIDDYYNNSPFPHPGTTWLRGLELAAGLLLREPTVDAVEVVRCKDCMHRIIKGYGRYQYRWCTAWNGINGMGDEGFCNYGERRTE